MIDTNIDLFRWPFRRVIGDDPASLVKRLQKKGVTQAWAGSYEALLCRDVAGLNIRLATACRQHGPNFLVPFGCVNPKSPDWDEDLRRCHEVHRMPGIRLYPNYHSYTLADPAFTKLLSMASERHLIVQIALSMEDQRTQFPLMPVPPVDPAPLADLIPRFPQLRLVLLNAGDWAGASLPSSPAIRKADNVYFDIAMNEGVGGLASLIADTAPDRVVFGSHYPFFYFESALLKVHSAALPRDQELAVYERNARLLLDHRV
ncbi:MAG: amidohydrolase family protein [Acidobacteriota bacterium]